MLEAPSNEGAFLFQPYSSSGSYRGWVLLGLSAHNPKSQPRSDSWTSFQKRHRGRLCPSCTPQLELFKQVPPGFLKVAAETKSQRTHEDIRPPQPGHRSP